jgi:hypothetical protein
MGTSRWRRSITALIFSASLLLAASASGGQGSPSVGHERIAFGTAHADGTNGYRVTVAGGGDGVTIISSLGRASVSYSVKGRAGGKRLRGDFGDLGFVNLRFHPRERAARGDDPPSAPVPCESERTRQPGVWKGELRFVGEGGFTSVSETRLRGKVETIAVNCEVAPTSPRRGERPERPVLFNATSFERETRTRTFVTALRSDFQHISRVFAAVFVRRGDLQAGYSVDRNVPRNTQRVHRHGTRFHLEGLPPFTGEGKFKRRHRRDGHWAGDLAVTLPVIGPVALTGPGFKASLRG